MMQPRSIRFRLSLVLFFFLIMVVVLGLFSIGRLKDLNVVSADIRDRWLQNTRYLGDLNNYTSDFRAAEANQLLSAGPVETIVSEKEIEDLDQSILKAQRGYEQIFHDAKETTIYAQFSTDWNLYRKIADQVLTLSRADRKAEGTNLYLTASRQYYNRASDTLGLLTDRNVANAREASDRADATYWEARLLIDIAILAAGLMVVAAIGYIRSSISNPLLIITTSMRQLAGNETDVEIPYTKRGDEIGEMARTVVVFRNNAIDLALSRHGLAQQALMLEEKLEQEQRLTALQHNFITMTSHEFRTPLGVIDGHAQRLIKMKDRLRSDEIAERSGKVRGAVLQLTNLLDNLLNSARLFDGADNLYFHPTKIDLAKLLQDVCHTHREITPEAHIVEKIETLPVIIGDPKLLHQMFSNLLSNAVKYSPHKGVVALSARCDPEHIIIDVQDNGIGIPDKDVDLLFERYYRGSNVSGIAGTGVGLYLVKMVLGLHNGTILVESQEGKGARFTLKLRLHNPSNLDD